MVLFTVQLSCSPLLQQFILVQFKKDVLGDFRLKLSRGATKDVKTDVEPLVYVGMDDTVLVAELYGCASLDESPCLGGCPILVRS